MKTKRLFPLLLALAALPLSAQEKAAEKPQTLPMVTLKKRTTFSAFAEFLRKETGRNVVVAADVANFYVPELLMENVSLTGLLHIVDQMSPDVEIGTVGEKPDLQVITIQASKENAEAKRRVTRVFKANVDAGKQGALQEMGMRVNQVMQVALKAEAEDGDLPNIECHPPTGLFIVKGRESQVSVVADIIAALGGEAVKGEAGKSQMTALESSIAEKTQRAVNQIAGVLRSKVNVAISPAQAAPPAIPEGCRGRASCVECHRKPPVLPPPADPKK